VEAANGIDDHDSEDAEEEAAEALQTLRRLQCTFAAAELSASGFGIAFAPNDAAGGGSGIVVASFVLLLTGAPGPAVHTGEQLQPGDVVMSVGVGTEAADDDWSKLLSGDGRLVIPSMSGSLATTLEFVRPVRTARRVTYLGGRPAKVKPKYGANARGKTGWASHVRDDELLGGAPARAARKPRRSRAADAEAEAVSEPTADEQIDAVFRAARMAGGGSSEQQREVERIAGEVAARVLAQRGLSDAQRAERDEEMREMVYSQ
jgi:hypothetical protein